MSAELARRLIHGGAAATDVEAALHSAAERGISLSQAVCDLHPELHELFDRALDRTGVPSLSHVEPLVDLVKALPLGICERLLAVPVARDAQSESVDLACVDVLDSHVASEFAFHLRVQVRVLRASFRDIGGALDALHDAGIFLNGLSRVLGESEAPPFVEAPPDEPVLSLARVKSPVASRSDPTWSLDFEAALARLEQAQSPDQVVTSLCEALAPAQALVFAVRGSDLEVRGGNLASGAEPMRGRKVAGGSFLDAALRQSFYLVPSTELAALELEWNVPLTSECYARVVSVTGRPSLIAVVFGFRDFVNVTRRADAVARVAGSALERIVRARKR